MDGCICGSGSSASLIVWTVVEAVPFSAGAVQVTQLGHVKDLATAFVKVLDNPKAAKQIYNISGERFVTFDGIAKACAKVAHYLAFVIISAKDHP